MYLVEGASELAGDGVLGGLGEVLEGDRHGQVLAQGVPAQVPLLQELLHVLGCGPASASLEQATTCIRQQSLLVLISVIEKY